MNAKKESHEEQEHRGQGHSKHPSPREVLEKELEKAAHARDDAKDEATRTYWQKVVDSLNYSLETLKEDIANSANN